MSIRPAGRLKPARRLLKLLRVHALGEPFYLYEGFGALAEDTIFQKGKTEFVGIMCCLVLKKEIPDIVA